MPRMGNLRIGIDVGGTFTHGVLLSTGGQVLVRARTATTHRSAHGVAEGVRTVLARILEELPILGFKPENIELVAHSTTQATNSLLEGDLSPVSQLVLVPPGEGMLAKRCLGKHGISLGAGRRISQQTSFIPLGSPLPPPAPSGEARAWPVVVVQPLAGRQDLRESAVAEALRSGGRTVVEAAAITRVLGLAARARTATVNAAMLPRMLATADFTARAVSDLLPGVPVQVVRSDGGAMSLAELRRVPVQSLLSGPAAGASAALDLSGLSEVLFLEVGGTSTDLTLIHHGRVRHRHAVVGGQRLMVPALDLRTVALGGGSMLCADYSRFGPRSAHIAGLPYLFQALAAGRHFKALGKWRDVSGSEYACAGLDDGSEAALTLTDLTLAAADDVSWHALLAELALDLSAAVRTELQNAYGVLEKSSPGCFLRARRAAFKPAAQAALQLAKTHGADLGQARIVLGGGGAPLLKGSFSTVLRGLARRLAPSVQEELLIAEHAVVSAVGAALAVTSASQSKSVASPGAADIAELTEEVEQRLRTQGAERVATDYEYDPQRQVLTVTGRGSRAFMQGLAPLSARELAERAGTVLNLPAEKRWSGDGLILWLASDARSGKLSSACALDSFGRSLFVGRVREYFPAAPGRITETLEELSATRTRYTDGGAVLPGLSLLCAGRLIPLDRLGSRELIQEVLRWENLPAQASGCFII